MKATLASLTACWEVTGIARVLQGEPTGCTRRPRRFARSNYRLGVREVPTCWALIIRFCVWASYVRATAREDMFASADTPYTRPWKLDAPSGKEDAHASSAEGDLRVGRQCNVTPRYHRRARATSQCTHLQRIAKTASRGLPGERQSR
ncbi:hypothetical protein K523DRAFT_262814, partial [Schizophyllum commune Tattone D]